MLEPDGPKWVVFSKCFSLKQAFFMKARAEKGFVIPGEIFEVTDVESIPDYTPS